MGIDELVRQLTGPDWATPITFGALLFPFLFGFVGIVANAAHRKWRGAEIRSIWEYFTRDRNWTVAMLSGYLIMFVVTAKVLHMNIAVAAVIGFMADNLLNRYSGGSDA